jgi:hypothetical protein
VRIFDTEEDIALLIVDSEFFVVTGVILAGSDVFSYEGGRGIKICNFLGDDYEDNADWVEEIP